MSSLAVPESLEYNALNIEPERPPRCSGSGERAGISVPEGREVRPWSIIQPSNERDIPTSIRHPIHKLPSELLALVFFFYVEAVVSQFSQPLLKRFFSTWDTPKAYSWLVIRHVCKLWRAVALHHPFLHTHIVLADPDCVEDQVRRSGRLPLSIYAVWGYRDLSSHAILKSCRTVFREASRIRHIQFQYTASLDSALQRPEFASLEFPSLLSLLLNFEDRGKEWRSPWAMYSSSPFIRVQMPHLHSYTAICGVAYAQQIVTLYDKPLRSTLRYLEIDSTRPLDGTPWPSETTLFDLLVQLDQLEELRLMNISSTVAPLQSARNVSLPRLASLRISDVSDTHIASTFLSYLIFPPTTLVSIQSRCSRPPEGSFDDTILALIRDARTVSAKLFGGGMNPVLIGTPKFIEVGIELTCRTCIVISVWVDSQITELVGLSHKPPPAAALIWTAMVDMYVGRRSRDLPLLQVLEAFPFSSVTSASIVGSGHPCIPMSAPTVIRALHSLDQVRVLGVHGGAPLYLVSQALQDPKSGHIFTHLQEWIVYHHQYNPKLQMSLPTYSQQLMDALTTRGAAGLGPRTLDIYLDAACDSKEELDATHKILIDPERLRFLDNFHFCDGQSFLSREWLRTELMRRASGTGWARKGGFGGHD